MKNLAINFWDKCSNHCIFCFCREKDFLTEEIGALAVTSLNDVKKALLEHRQSCDQVIISGNEPTLNPKLLHAILLAKEIGYKAEIRTNGRTLKDRKFCLKLLKVGLNSLGITLLSHNKKTHETLTQRKGSFRETVLGIKNFVSLGEASRVTVYNVITKFNYQQLPKYIVFLYHLGARNIQLNFVYHNSKKIVPRFSDLSKPLQKALALATRLRLSIGTYGVPLCFLGKYLRLATEFRLKNEILLGGRISDYHYLRINLGKKKSKYCKECSKKDICEGTWKSYYNVYGEEEFKNKAL